MCEKKVHFRSTLQPARSQQFAQGSDLLESHTALLSLRRLVEMNQIPATGATVADIDPLLADTHAFEELRLLSQLRSRPTTLNGAVRSAEALVAQYSYTPDASPQR